MRYWPVPSLTAVRVFSMRTGLDTSTVTPGRTAPDVSFTTPVIDASTPCAEAIDGTRAATASRTNSRTTPRIIPTSVRDLFRRVRLVQGRRPFNKRIKEISYTEDEEFRNLEGRKKS